MEQQAKRVVVPVPRTDRSVVCRTSPGLFSADRLDDGTRLLLAHLPAGVPADVLDLGCGWGALSVAVAAAFPGAQVQAVDRDLLAVQVTAENAAALGLTRVVARGSIGTRDLPAEARFDWALCNVPARIGTRGIEAILAGCARRLRPGGALHVVVIADLLPTTVGLGAAVVARSRNHVVLSVAPRELAFDEQDLAPYARDEVTVAGRTLTRPVDFGEDPAHLRDALPLLLDVLPRSPLHSLHAEDNRVAVVRAGYGAIALELAARGARTIAVERDLLAAAFVERNAARHGLALEVRTAAWLPDALTEPLALAIVEAAEPMGLTGAVRELASIRDRLATDGRVLFLARTRFAEAVRGATPSSRVLAARSGFTVLEARPTRN